MNHNTVIYEIDGNQIEYYDPNDPEIHPVPTPEPHHIPHHYPNPHNDPHNDPHPHNPNSTSPFMMNGIGLLGLNVFFLGTIIVSFGLYVARCIDLHRENTRIIRQNRRSRQEINVDNLNTLLLCNELPDESCSICLEDFKTGDNIKKLNCTHIFHKECLEPWLNSNNRNCPMCRTDII
tara:strand:- start:5 stop:538 length:534 start_codon:yes stop_codon:yes gene_type:complete